MTAYRQQRKEVEQFLDRVDDLCDMILRLNSALDHVDRLKWETKKETVYEARLLLNILIELNKDIRPKKKTA